MEPISQVSFLPQKVAKYLQTGPHGISQSQHGRSPKATPIQTSQITGYKLPRPPKKVGMPPQALSGHLPARVSRCASDIGSHGVDTTAPWQPGATVHPRQPPLHRPPILGQACQTATAAREARSPRSQGPGPRTPALLSSAINGTKLRLRHYGSSRGGTPRAARTAGQSARRP